MPLPIELLLDVADHDEAGIAVQERLVVADARSHVDLHVEVVFWSDVQQVPLQHRGGLGNRAILVAGIGRRLLDALNVAPLHLDVVLSEVALNCALDEGHVHAALDAEADLAVHQVGREDVVLVDHGLDVVGHGHQDLHAKRSSLVAVEPTNGLFETAPPLDLDLPRRPARRGLELLQGIEVV